MAVGLGTAGKPARNKSATGLQRVPRQLLTLLTHYCRTKRNGRFGLGRKPVPRRVRRTLQAVKAALWKRMHENPVQTGRWLGRVLRGWLGYYAVPTSSRSLQRFALDVMRLWLRILRRRSQRDVFAWERLAALCQRLWPRVSILHPWPAERFAVTHSR